MSSLLVNLSHLLQYNLKNRFRKAAMLIKNSDLWVDLAKPVRSSTPISKKPVQRLIGRRNGYPYNIQKERRIPMEIRLDPKTFAYMKKKQKDCLHVFLQISGMC